MAGINLEGRAVLVEDATPKPVASFGDMMQEMARVSAEEAAQARQEAGITRSLTDTDKAVRTAMMQEPVSTLEPALPLENAIPEPSPVGVEELEPAPLASVEGQIIETPQQPTQGGAAIGQDQPITQPSAEQTTILPDQPAGLVAPTLGEQPSVDALSNQLLEKPVAATEPTGPLSDVLDTKGYTPAVQEVDAGTTDTTITDLVYNDFVKGKQEGDEAHVGQDNKNITLAGGVVPDGLKYNGKDFTQGSSVVTGFDKTKLDTSGAYKKVGTVTVKRSDFDSDKAFAKGVIKEFANQAEAAAGTNWSSLSEGSKKAVIKIGWNKGAGWYSGESAKAIYEELAKDQPNPDNIYSKILVGSTVKGGGASIGISKARANAWNETISATGGKEITRIDADNSGKNTAFKYYDKDGNLLHTEQTTRASKIYENKITSVSKNANGVW